MKQIWPLAVLGFLVGMAWMFSAGAQQQNAQPVTTLNAGVSSVHADGTISSNSAFQSVFASAIATPQRPRRGCLIQNLGSHTEYIWVGPIASATSPASYALVPPGTGVQGGSFSCATGAGAVLQDQISIQGTSADTFAATAQ